MERKSPHFLSPFSTNAGNTLIISTLQNAHFLRVFVRKFTLDGKKRQNSPLFCDKKLTKQSTLDII